MQVRHPTWSAVQTLSSTGASIAQTLSSRLRMYLRNLQHRAKHCLHNQPCTDACFADAFERASLLHSPSRDPSRSNSYDTLCISPSSAAADDDDDNPQSRRSARSCGCTQILQHRIRDWTTATLDLLDGTRRPRHSHQAAIDPESCHRLVAHLRKQRQGPGRRRSSASYRWVQRPRHGWVYERYT